MLLFNVTQSNCVTLNKSISKGDLLSGGKVVSKQADYDKRWENLCGCQLASKY